MTGNLIVSTPKISMHPLAFQGIMAYTCFPQIRDMLLRHFGDEYVLLFARPAENAGDGRIDWYSPVQGVARPLTQLPEAEREAVCAQIARMANEILAFADELVNSRDPLKVTRGNILKLALRYPDDSALYVIGEQPVFTCWGFGPGTPGVEGRNLAKLAPATPTPQPTPAPQPPAPEIPVPVRPARFAWLAWLWPLIPALLLFILLFSAFGHIPALSGHSLFHLPALPFLEEPTDTGSLVKSLQREIDSLRSQVERHADLCVPEKPQSKKPETNVEIGEPVAEQAESGAKAPLLPAQPRPEPTGEKLLIPENARTTEFLEGAWRCDTGLANSRTNEPVTVDISFNKDGLGTSTTMEKNDICRGAVKARLENGVLHIDVGEQPCQNSNGGYRELQIECKNAKDKTTRCYGTNSDGSTWDAEFRKYK